MKKLFIIISSVTALIASVVTVVQFYNQFTMIDISGEWTIKDTIQTGFYKNSTLEFKVFINQNGTTFTGEGEKYTYNDLEVSTKQKTRLQLTNGIIDGDHVQVTFIEHGLKRQTRGQFVWKYQNDRKLHGTFSSTASKGVSTIYK